MTKTIYLANAYGFSLQQRTTLLPPLVAALEALDLEVWEPFARNNQIDFLEAGWGVSDRPRGLPRCGHLGCHLRGR